MGLTAPEMDPEVQQPVSGSFRDREGRVYLHRGRVLRGLSEQALGNFRALKKTRFYQHMVARDRLIQSSELKAEDNPLPREIVQAWAGFLEHEKVPVVSYPYEWSFSMLKAAALLQLDLLAAALSEDWTLKDATPYNIQFIDGRPVFIDLPSFEPLEPGAPWVGRKQFCEMYLFPLMLQAHKGLHFQPFLRSSIDGVSVQAADALFGLGDRFRKGVLGNVWLQARLERRYANSDDNVRASLKNAGFNKELIKANVSKLRKTIAALIWDGAGSEWGDYAEFHNYSDEDHQQKERFVERCIEQVKPELAWDIGANTGQFSKLAAKNTKQVVATDIDHLAVERMFIDEGRPANVLPLVQNVVDPSPSWGWRNRERTDLVSRARPDLVLCLALIHHVVITANVPLKEFIEWLASLTPNLVIEYVSRKDDKVQKLLRNKEDRYWDYTREHFETQLARNYAIENRQELRQGARHLYFCRRAAA